MAFHRHLDGDGPQPFEHFVGRLCEEFPTRLPSEMWAEVQRLPSGFLERLIEYRAYAVTKHAYDSAKTKEARAALRADRLGAEVERMTFELVKADVANTKTHG